MPLIKVWMTKSEVINLKGGVKNEEEIVFFSTSRGIDDGNAP